jgi:hypothetical protein
VVQGLALASSPCRAHLFALLLLLYLLRLLLLDFVADYLQASPQRISPRHMYVAATEVRLLHVLLCSVRRRRSCCCRRH